MTNLIFRPETTYTKECIRERFEVPADAVPHPNDTDSQRAFKLIFIQECAKIAGQRAIERYERLRHWRFLDSIPVELDESSIQLDLDDYEFSSPLSTSPMAKDQGHLTLKKQTHAYVLKMWFVTQEIQAIVWKSDPQQTFEDELTHAEGLANPEEVNQHYQTLEEVNTHASA